MAGTTVESSIPQMSGAELDDAAIDAAAPELGAADDVAPSNGADPAIETRAREMGWKPLAEFRGRAGTWKPAAEFISRGEEVLPIVRDQNRRLLERVNRLESEVGGLRTSSTEQLQIIKDLRDMGRKADQRGYDRAMADIKTKKAAAVEAGDTKAYQQFDQQEDALRESRSMTTPAVTAITTESGITVTAAPQVSPPPLNVSTAVKEFVALNAWFNSTPVLNAAMIAHHNEVLRERGITQDMLNNDTALERELLDEAKDRVMDAYPRAFGTAPLRDEPAARPVQPRRRAASVSAPTGDAPAPRSNGQAATINSIADPAERTEARDAYNRIKRNLPDYSEAEYMALYADPHADVITLQQQKRNQPNGRQ
jgi:hypothetical protein